MKYQSNWNHLQIYGLDKISLNANLTADSRFFDRKSIELEWKCLEQVIDSILPKSTENEQQTKTRERKRITHFLVSGTFNKSFPTYITCFK